MSFLPRVALGSNQPECDSTFMLWALVELLKQHGHKVQIFCDQARFGLDEENRAVCGDRPRYLDSWLMSPELCRESFAFGMESCSVAVVHGAFQTQSVQAPSVTCGAAANAGGGQLEPLADWLDLTRLAVVDVSQARDCRLPAPPPGVDAVLLDRFAAADLPRWQTILEALWGVPVLGGLPEVPILRRQMQSCIEHGVNPCSYCKLLGEHLGSTLRFDKLIKLATRPYLQQAAHVFRPGGKLDGLSVAMAYDEALNCYFPDVIDLLELQGARIRDFSPLRDEALPPDVDVVYLGGGHPERFAAELAANSCMAVALRDHARRGKRIYAEAGGMAYLCRYVCLPSGELYPMAGVLPAMATFKPQAGPPQPAEITLASDHWLGSAGTTLRGYVHPGWEFDPIGSVDSLLTSDDPPHALLASQQALGSRLHINFAAQPEFLRRFSSVGASSLC